MVMDPQRAMNGSCEKYSTSRPSVKEIELFVSTPHEHGERIVLRREEEEQRKLRNGKEA